MISESQSRLLCLFIERESISLSLLFLLLIAAHQHGNVASVHQEGRHICSSNNDLLPVLSNYRKQEVTKRGQEAWVPLLVITPALCRVLDSLPGVGARNICSCKIASVASQEEVAAGRRLNAHHLDIFLQVLSILHPPEGDTGFPQQCFSPGFCQVRHQHRHQYGIEYIGFPPSLAILFQRCFTKM